MKLKVKTLGCAVLALMVAGVVGAIPVNEPPMPFPQTLWVAEDWPYPITLEGSDAEGDDFTFAVETQPSHGVLTGTAPNLTYTPNPEYNGPDSFTFSVSAPLPDGREAMRSSVGPSTATVTIEVFSIDDAPIAVAQQVFVVEDTPQTVTLTVTDVDGGAATYVVTSGPSHGALSGTAPNLTYTPAPNYSGQDSFTFEVTGGGPPSLRSSGVVRAGAGPLPSSAVVDLSITPVNDAPSFVKGVDQSVAADAGPQIVAPWATALSAGPADEASQTLAFLVTNDNNALFSEQPAVSPNGTLTYAVATGQSGVANVAVILADDGGRKYDGVDTSAPQTSTISVTAAAAGADLAISLDAADRALRGGHVAVSVQVVNRGPLAASGVAIPDFTPAGLSLVSGDGVCSTLPCDIGALAVDATADLRFVFLVPSSYDGPDTLVYTATATGNDPDPVATNDQATASVPLNAPGDYYTLIPCRVFDTRAGFPAAVKEPSLEGGTPRTVAVAGHCGIPASARSVVLNVTAVNPTATGHFRIWPGGDPMAATSSLNYGVGQTRAVLVVAAVSADGGITLAAFQDAGSVDLLLDVFGYFE